MPLSDMHLPPFRSSMGMMRGDALTKGARQDHHCGHCTGLRSIEQFDML
jgi:hypothetical protein